MGKKKAVKRRPHATVRLSIKVASIDRKMVPVIEWLNSFDGVFTKHCCQGDDIDHSDPTGHRQEPYVVFASDSMASLFLIVNSLGGYGEVTILPVHETRAMDFRLSFRDCQSLQWLVEKIKARRRMTCTQSM